MKPGDKVMVPRTGGGSSLGEVLVVYEDRVWVAFPIGLTYQGRSQVLACTGYKTFKLDELLLVKEGRLCQVQDQER